MAKEKLKGKPLTDPQLTALSLGKDGKAKVYADGGGLYLIVRPAFRGTSRSFGFRGTLNGKQLPMMHIGPIKKWSLAKARAERDRCNALIREGKDPRQVRVIERAKPDAQPPTVNRLLNRYFEKKVEPKRQFDTEDKRRDRITRAMRHLQHISDTIGKMSVADVTTEILLKNVGLDERWETKRPSASELRMHLRKAFAMAVALKWTDINPASDENLDPVLSEDYHRSTPRASLNYEDAPRFVAAVKAYKNRGRGMSERPLATVPPLLFLIYTGVRTEEVIKARWGEIDRPNLLWNVPPGHRKGRKGDDRKSEGQSNPDQ